MRSAYPTFPASCWWPLRERFKNALPQAVTAEYLQTVLEVEPKTARNLVPMLRQMGLVDDAGALRERANAWRVDSEYPMVCRAMRDEIYPASLREAIDDPVREFDAAVRWFMKQTGVGTAAAKRMARFYALLSKADPSDNRERADAGARSNDRATSRPSGREGAQRQPRAPMRNGAPGFAAAPTGRPVNGSGDRDPTYPGTAAPAPGRVATRGITVEPIAAGTPPASPVQVIVQIQLAADATPEQIDQLVASIARHLMPPGARRD